MAITAAMTVGSATAKALAKTSITCTVTNSGTPAVNVTSIVPTVTVSGKTSQQVPFLLGKPPTGPGMATSVPGSSGTLAFTWDGVGLSPNAATYTTNPFPSSGPGMPSGASPLPPVAEPTSVAYAVGAIVYTSDGSVTTATTTTITVTPVNY